MPHSWWSLAASLPKVCGWHVCCFGLAWWCIGFLEMLEWVTTLIAVYDGEWGWWAAAFHGRTSQEGGECIYHSSLSEADIHGLVHAVGQCPTSQKIALVRSLVQRARKICSPQYLDGEMETLQLIFEKNGYPGPIVSHVIQQTLESEPRRTSQQRKEDKVFIRLPWLGPKSAAFRNRIHRATIDALPDCKAVCTFLTRRMFNTARKTYFQRKAWVTSFTFSAVHVSRATLEGRHNAWKNASSSTFLRAWSVRLGLRRRSQRRRRRRGSSRTRGRRRPRRRREQQIKAMTVRMQEARKRTWHWQQLNMTVTCAKGGNRNVLKVSKSDSGITRHLKTCSQCKEAVCKSNVTARFQVIARARNASHFGFLETLFIGRNAPALCAQREFVCTLGLF